VLAVEEVVEDDVDIRSTQKKVSASNTNARETITIDADLGEVGIEQEEDVDIVVDKDKEVFMHDRGITVESIYNLDDSCKFFIELLLSCTNHNIGHEKQAKFTTWLVDYGLFNKDYMENGKTAGGSTALHLYLYYGKCIM